MRFQWQGLRGCSGSAHESLLAQGQVLDDADILVAMPASVCQQQFRSKRHRRVK